MGITARHALVAVLACTAAMRAHAQQSPLTLLALPSDTQRRQQEQLLAAQQATVPAPSLLQRPSAIVSPRLEFPLEADCMTIKTADWRGAQDFPWLIERTPVEGACIGPRGVKALRDWIAGELIARGFFTARVEIGADDLKHGRIAIDVIAGRIGAIRDEGDSVGWNRVAFPTGPGDLLNVRDMDEALETMRRLPGQQGVAFDLLPGAMLGETDIVVKHPESKRWHVLLSADNSGIDASGRDRLGAVLALDSPLHLYDQLILSASTDAELADHTRASLAKSASWNVPLGYASLSIGVSEWVSTQPFAVLGDSVPYTTRTRRAEIGIGFAPYRSQDKKGSLQFKVVRRTDDTTLGGAEVDIQNHDITGYEASFDHQQEFPGASVKAGVGVRGSFAGVSRNAGFVYGEPDWNGGYEVASANASVTRPFSIGTRRFAYRSAFFLQAAPTPLPSTEYLQIGGLYTVRGFDGNSTLSAPSGWLWRNELATGAGPANEAYVTLDAGRVYGAPVAAVDGRSLAGASLGLRGSYRNVGYDVSMGLPLVQPSSFGSRKPNLSVSLTSRF